MKKFLFLSFVTVLLLAYEKGNQPKSHTSGINGFIGLINNYDKLNSQSSADNIQGFALQNGSKDINDLADINDFFYDLKKVKIRKNTSESSPEQQAYSGIHGLMNELMDEQILNNLYTLMNDEINEDIVQITIKESNVI